MKCQQPLLRTTLSVTCDDPVLSADQTTRAQHKNHFATITSIIIISSLAGRMSPLGVKLSLLILMLILTCADPLLSANGWHCQAGVWATQTVQLDECASVCCSHHPEQGLGRAGRQHLEGRRTQAHTENSMSKKREHRYISDKRLNRQRSERIVHDEAVVAVYQQHIMLATEMNA